MNIKHFTATGIVFNSNNEILMVNHKKLQVWLPPGGHIEENELPDDAVLREIFEETGIIAEILFSKQCLVLSSKNCRELERPFTVLLEDIEGNGTHNHIDMVYLCRAISKELLMQESEIDDVGWFSLDRIKTLKTYDNVIQTIIKAVDYINNENIGLL